jgi:hypothetical protein
MPAPLGEIEDALARPARATSTSAASETMTATDGHNSRFIPWVSIF